MEHEMEDKPQFFQNKNPLKIVIEGVGDVVKKNYLPALKNLKSELSGNREIHITFIDESKFWRGKSGLEHKMLDTIAEIKNWGAEYLDKSNPEDIDKYKLITPDVVIIATPDFTHLNIAEGWIKRQIKPGQIFIEKPLDSSLNTARHFLGLIPPFSSKVLAFDHYRARLLPSRTQMDMLLGFLGKGLKRFTFYLLEDHSGDDPNYNPAVQRNGPIENEQRVKTLNEGVIMDLMPHIIAILAHFCRAETLRVTRVKAAQYVGVDIDPNKRTEIGKETFAEVCFVCSDYAGNSVKGEAYLGKGIRGVKALGKEYDFNTKLLEIEGLNQNIARFDLRSSGQGHSKASLIEDEKTQFEFDLYAKPYNLLLEKIANGNFLENPSISLPVEVGKRMLEILQDMRFPIPNKEQLPTYPSGMSSGHERDSLYLEDFLDNLPILYGNYCLSE